MSANTPKMHPEHPDDPAVVKGIRTRLNDMQSTWVPIPRMMLHEFMEEYDRLREEKNKS